VDWSDLTPARSAALAVTRALAFARQRRDESLAELGAFLRIPTVSAEPLHARDVRRGANWLARHLRAIGLENVRVMATPRHPIVYADWLLAPGRPTLLIYGHYDVQPADPLHEWRSPPFNPTLRGDNLIARGASDDKGQLFAHVKALEAYLHAGSLPLNVKCLFEGEEEIGSPNLFAFVARHRDALSADAVVMSDTRMLAADRPAISYAERGALNLELEVRGPRHDLHSGNFGGVVHNPLQALCELIASLHDARGRIAIEGIYDRVRAPSPGERHHMARVGPSDRQILAEAATNEPWGEPGFSAYERLTLRPALTVNGITGGYHGSGHKGIIPARASAKIGIRLVPDQTPRDMYRLFLRHLARMTPPSVRVRVRPLSGAAPAVVDPRHPALHAAADAYRRGFGRAPAFIRSGGTIPILHAFRESLRVPIVLMGFALPDDRLHAPNEKLHVPTFYKGIDTCIHFMDALSSRLFSTRHSANRSAHRLGN